MNAVVNEPNQGQPARPDRNAVEILDEHFQRRRVSINDDRVTGRQVAEAAGYNSTDELIVLQQLATGALEEIRPEELGDLAQAGVERFFVIEGDSTFRFILDGLKLEWPRQTVTGKLLLQLAGKSDGFEVVQELEAEPDKILDDDDVVNLNGEGTERFKTRHAPKLVTVYYNHNPVQIERGVYTTEQLLAFFQVESGYVLDLVRPSGEFIELKPGATLRVHEGQKFISHAPCGQSS